MLGRPKGRSPRQLCIKGCGHQVGRGKGNVHGMCPPLRGVHGDRYHSLVAKRGKIGEWSIHIDRGAAVKGVGGSKAASHRRVTTKTI
jgi:hypothetical protein